MFKMVFSNIKKLSQQVVTWKTGPIRVPEILSKDEIQVFLEFKTACSRGANAF